MKCERQKFQPIVELQRFRNPAAYIYWFSFIIKYNCYNIINFDIVDEGKLTNSTLFSLINLITLVKVLVLNLYTRIINDIHIRILLNVF